MTTADITPKTLGVSGTTANNKVYDGNAMATLSGGTLSGLISGDDVQLKQSGSFNNKYVGFNKPVTYSNSLAGSDNGNYTLASAGGTSKANITPTNLWQIIAAILNSWQHPATQ